MLTSQIVRAWILVVLVAMAGCFGGFRVEVDAASLEASPLDWERSATDEQGEALGLKVMETRYIHNPEDERDPPYPGSLQVFSMRGGSSQDRDWLQQRAHEAVDKVIAEIGIQVDHSLDRNGERTLRSGVTSHWFTHEGTIAPGGGGSLLSPTSDITVRIIGEVAVDGRSKTGVISVGFAKVSGERGGLAGVGNQEITDSQTWFDLVGDPAGSVAGASYSNPDRGLMYNLVTNA